MTKPANLVLEFSKAEPLWKVMVDDIQDASLHELAEKYIARLAVKSLSLEDHQFIQISFKRKSGADAVTWIPRQLVKMIVEGKAKPWPGITSGEVKAGR